MRLKLLSRNYRFKVPTDHCAGLALYSFYHKVTVQVRPPEVRGHANHTPGTRVAGVDIVDHRLSKNNWYSDIFVDTHTAGTYLEISPVGIYLRV